MPLKLTSLSVDSKSNAIETNTLAIEAEGSGRRDARRIAGGVLLGTMVGAIADGETELQKEPL